MLTALHIIAERRITEAIEQGAFDLAHWKNKPLPQEDNMFVPEDLRMAYKIMKNSGFLPPEIELKKKICKLEELIDKNQDEHSRVKQIKKLNVLVIKLNSMRQSPINLQTDSDYYRKVVERISVKNDK